MWTPFKYFVGTWQGTGSGEPGTGQYERSYEFILNDRFLHVRNKSIYPPHEDNPQGEVHEDWGFISRDKARATFVYRQFHIEGFVNQYVLDHITQDGKEIVFVTENIENIQAGWRAKENYKILSPDEFTEVFELAAPGKDFKVYTECLLRRTA